MKIVKLIISLLIALTIGLAFSKGFTKNIEYMAEDGVYQNPGVIPDNIIIVTIDEESFSRLGPYSDWDRSYFAKLIEVLNENEETVPAVIGIDVVFSGSNNSAGDKMLVDVATKYDNLIFASSVNFDTYLYKENNEYKNGIYIADETKPYEGLAEVTEYGFTNIYFEDDLVVRTAYTSVASNYNDETIIYDSFAYKIASKYGTVKEYEPMVKFSYVSMPGEFETVSMAEVIDGKIPEGYFKDCIVLVGAYEESMMDAHKVPIDYSEHMFGVEIQANIINALLNDRIIYDVNNYVQLVVMIALIAGYTFFALNTGMRNTVVGLFLTIIAYLGAAILLYHLTSYQMMLISVPIGLVLAFLISVIYKYIENQKKRVLEMQNMLFSMSEAMAEAIEGRTPYNANHTKNVAKRCVELMEYINTKHRQKKTGLSFTKSDKQQMYLAAMLHDVGKMDVPLGVMDKATKLGNKEKELRSRLDIISLHIENDALTGLINKDEANAQIMKIKTFVQSLDGFNCGRPLKEEEWALVNEISDSVYVDKDGIEIPYMTGEEIADLHIKAGTLSEKERIIMQNHVVYTDKILSHMHFGEHFKDVRTIASNHHELLNGKGYPKGLKNEEIDVMTRILTVMDIYDSLIADDRPYKKPKSVKVAFEILDEEAEAGKVDKEILQFAKELYMN